MSKYNIVSNDERYLKITELASRLFPDPPGYEGDSDPLAETIRQQKLTLEGVGGVLVLKTLGRVALNVTDRVTISIDGERSVYGNHAYLDIEGEHLIGIIGEYNLAEMVGGELLDVVSWHFYDSPRFTIASSSATITLPSTIAYVDFNQFLGRDFKGRIEFDSLDDYNISSCCDLKVGDCLVGSRGFDSLTLTGILPSSIRDSYGEMRIDTFDSVPSDFCGKRIGKLFLKTPLVDEFAFDGCLIDEIHFLSDMEIGEYAFRQPYRRKVEIHSSYDLSDFDWEGNNIIPIFKEIRNDED